MVTEVLSGVKFKMVRVGSGAKRKSSRMVALRAQGHRKEALVLQEFIFKQMVGKSRDTGTPPPVRTSDPIKAPQEGHILI